MAMVAVSRGPLLKLQAIVGHAPNPHDSKMCALRGRIT
jgi:hypothetical protein